MSSNPAELVPTADEQSALTPAPPRAPALTLGTLRDYGEVFAQSGYFKDARDAAQAIVKILYGQELGLTPVQSMVSVYIVEGKPGLSADAKARLLRQSGRYDYRVTERTAERCTVAIYVRSTGEELGRATWTLEMAQRAGLAGKSVWRSYPERMLFNRAVSDAIHTHAPDAIAGVFYDLDELAEMAAPVAAPPEPPPSVVAESDPDAPTEDVASPAQRRKIFAVARANDWSDEQIRTMLRELCGVPSSDRLPARLVDVALATFQGPPPADAPQRTDGEDGGADGGTAESTATATIGAPAAPDTTTEPDVLVEPSVPLAVPEPSVSLFPEPPAEPEPPPGEPEDGGHYSHPNE